VIELEDIQPQPGRPLYEVVKDVVRQAIDDGRIAPGQRLPSTKKLSSDLSVSLVTVHRAMQELVANGVLRRGQGKGTFVHEDYGAAGRRGHGHRLGLVFHKESSLGDAYHGQILEGVRQQAHDIGMDLVLLRFGEDWRNECQAYLYVNPLAEQLTKSPRSNRQGHPLPVMVVGASFDIPGVCCVDSDNAWIGRHAVSHLASLGHRRIGFVGGLGSISNDRDRFAGFESGMRSLGVDSNCVCRCAGWRMNDEDREVLVAALRRWDRPTAIFAAGYHFALDVYKAAESAGLSIPRDLSVIGVDDPPSAEHLEPALTTFRQPLVALGREAVDKLLTMLSDTRAKPARTTLLRPDFVARESTGHASFSARSDS